MTRLARSKLVAPLLAALLGAGGAMAQGSLTDGEVRKVDVAGAKLTLKHGEIKSLDMPPLTMVYRVQDAAVLSRLKPGDKVRFRAERIGGQYTVTVIQLAR